MRTPVIETERLILREVQSGDVKAVFDCWMQDEEVSRYMWWKASTDIREAQSFVEAELSRIEDDRWYRWIIIEKAAGEIIGTCLVFYHDEEEHWDVSYNLGRRFWGNGYATEAMRAVMRFAETELDMRECITTYAKVNHGSAGVLHKLGFKDEKSIRYECSGGELATEGVLCRYQSPFITPPGHVSFKAKKLFGEMGRIKDGAIAYMNLQGGGPTEPHTHEHNHLFIVVKGEAKALLGEKEVIIRENEAFLVEGKIPHSVWNNTKGKTVMIGISTE